MLSAFIEKADRAIAFQIVHQDDKITNKLRNGSFIASNGWAVKMDIAPEIDILNKTIYLRGSDTSKDSRISRVWDLSSNSNRDTYVKEIDSALDELVHWANSPTKIVVFGTPLHENTYVQDYTVFLTEWCDCDHGTRRPTPCHNPKIANKPIVRR